MPAENGFLFVSASNSEVPQNEYQFRWRTISPMKSAWHQSADRNGVNTKFVIWEYHFLLPIGWTGRDCEVNIYECESNPCQNGATCIDHVNGYNCDCADEYYGDLCEKKVDNCLGGNPDIRLCENGATCVDRVGRVDCLCPPQNDGIFCEKGRS